MAAALYADEPDYSAIIFRKTYQDLNKDGALMDRAHDWFGGTAARWNDRDKRWSFPSGATVGFGYLDAPGDWRNYDSAEYQYEGFDESTQLRAKDYTNLLGRIRRKAGSRIPLRARSASNPGGESHEFFGERFVEPAEPHPERAFIPALLEDNPYLDREAYEEALENLDEILYRQRRYGEWIPDSSLVIFKREWWDPRKNPENRYSLEDAHYLWNACVGRYISLDTADTNKETSAYSALTVGDLQPDYRLPLRYAAREKLELPELLEWVTEQLAPFNEDEKLRALIVENAASGRQLIQTLRKSGPPRLRNIIVAIKPRTEKNRKEHEWRAASVWCKRGMMPLPMASPQVHWLHPYESELFAVPNTTYKDQADSTAQLINYLEARHQVFSHRWRYLMSQAA